MRRFLAVFTFLICLALLPTPARAACTNATLSGTYGFHEQGQAIGEGFSQFRGVGTLTFDGKGNATGPFTLWYSNLTVAEGQLHILYTVNSNCTFTYTYVENGETFTGTIVGNGGQYFYLETTGDPMRSGEAVKITVGQNKQ